MPRVSSSSHTWYLLTVGAVVVRVTACRPVAPSLADRKSTPSELQSQSNLVCPFFFLMIRRPPRSTLFPYTTLSDLFPYLVLIDGGGCRCQGDGLPSGSPVSCRNTTHAGIGIFTEQEPDRVGNGGDAASIRGTRVVDRKHASAKRAAVREASEHRPDVPRRAVTETFEAHPKAEPTRKGPRPHIRFPASSVADQRSVSASRRLRAVIDRPDAEHAVHAACVEQLDIVRS